jgi:hypothetical protein
MRVVKKIIQLIIFIENKVRFVTEFFFTILWLSLLMLLPLLFLALIFGKQQIYGSVTGTFIVAAWLISTWLFLITAILLILVSLSKSSVYKLIDILEYNLFNVAIKLGSPAIALKLLANSPHVKTRISVAQFKKTPKEILQILIDDPDWNVRAATLENPNLTPDLEDRLAHDLNENILAKVAQSPTASATALAHLSQDSSYRIRALVASSPSTPTDILANLAYDPDSTVQANIAANPATSWRILDLLIENICQTPYTAFLVVNTLIQHHEIESDRLEKIIDSCDSRTIYRLAKNPDLSVESLRKLCRNHPELLC